MLEKRIIPTLLLSEEVFVKTTKFKKPNYIGDPINTIRILNEKEVDEILIYDIDCSKKNISPNFKLLENIASEAFIPMAYGGGIKNMKDMEKVFNLGYEKVSLGYSALMNKSLILEAIENFGQQSIMASVDVKYKFLSSQLYVYDHSKSKNTRTLAFDFISYLSKIKVGEVTVNFVDRDGTMEGYLIDDFKYLTSKLTIPTIISCGAWTDDDLINGLRTNASAVAAGSKFVYNNKEKAVLINYPEYNEVKNLLSRAKQ